MEAKTDRVFQFRKGADTYSIYYDEVDSLLEYLSMLKFDDIFVFSCKELIKLTNYIGKGGG